MKKSKKLRVIFQHVREGWMLMIFRWNRESTGSEGR